MNSSRIGFVTSALVATALAICVTAGPVSAAPVSITNHSFQDPVIPTGGGASDEDAQDTDPGSPPGWTYLLTNPPASPSWGVVRPDPDAHYLRDITGGETAPHTPPFDGDQLGFVNMNNDPASVGGASNAQVDSAVLGTLAPGTYTLRFAVGGRNTGSWRNVNYTIGLVGAISGPLGTPTTQLIDPGNAAGNLPAIDTATNAYNVVDMQYILTVPTGSALIGENYSIRLTAANTGLSGTGAFTQANFDNARLDFVPVPEPASAALAACSAMALAALARRRR